MLIIENQMTQVLILSSLNKDELPKYISDNLDKYDEWLDK